MSRDEVIRRHTGRRVHRRLHRLRAGLRLPERRRPGPERAAPRHAAHAHPGRRRGAGRPVQRRLSAGQPGRLADHRRDRYADVGSGARGAGAAAAGLSGCASSIGRVADLRRHRPYPRPRLSRHRSPTSLTALRWRSAAPACRPCSRTPAAMARPGRACRPRARWTRAALRAANRLVGNAGDAACVEIVYGGFQLVCRGEAVVAFTGADAPIELATADGAAIGGARLPGHRAADGDSLTLGAAARRHAAPTWRCAAASPSRRCWAAARPTRWPSVGPAPIAAGDLLPVRPVHARRHRRPARAAARRPAHGAADRHARRGDGPAHRLVHARGGGAAGQPGWKVTPQSNRVGLRLAGEQPLARANPAELPSEGTVARRHPGAAQRPARAVPGRPPADRRLSGDRRRGPYHLDRAGQIPIGASVRFNPIQPFGTAP